MKCFLTLGSSLLTISLTLLSSCSDQNNDYKTKVERPSSGEDLMGHESGGREGASTINLRFASPGDGIDRWRYDAMKELIDHEVAEGRVEEMKEYKWGREGEIDVCLKMADLPDSSRYLSAHKLQRNLSRINYLGPERNFKTTFSRLSVGSCKPLLYYSGFDLGPYSLETDPKKQPVSAKCHTGVVGPDRYRAALEVIELRSDPAKKVTTQFRWLQQSTSAKYAMISGEFNFSEFQTGPSLKFDNDMTEISLEIDLKNKINNGEFIHDGVVTFKGNSLEVTCEL